MAKRKLISVSLSGKDVEKFNLISDYLNEKNLAPKDAEILKMSLRTLFDSLRNDIENVLNIDLNSRKL